MRDLLRQRRSEWTTQLPLPPRTALHSLPETAHTLARPRRDAAYWEQVMAGQHFAVEDHLDEARFNRALWHGLPGETTPYPTVCDGPN
jgi:hypothetical protein